MSFTRPAAEKRLANGGAELFMLPVRVLVAFSWGWESQFTAMIDDLIG